MATHFSPATPARSILRPPKALLSIRDSYGGARVWKKCQPSAVNMCSSSSAASYVTPPGGVAKFSGNPIVVKEQLLQKRAGTVRGATIEEIEAEKSVIEKDSKGRMEKTLKWYDPISILLGQGGQAQPCWARLRLTIMEVQLA